MHSPSLIMLARLTNPRIQSIDQSTAFDIPISHTCRGYEGNEFVLGQRSFGDETVGHGLDDGTEVVADAVGG